VTLDILYRDRWLLVLNKPSGLLAVPGRGPDKRDCLAARARREAPEALVVHRLDRDTSGAIVMALDPATQRALSGQFERREVRKTYRAVVLGQVADEQGEIDLPLRKDFDRPPRHMVELLHGRPARTRWRVLRREADRTRLELMPVTGRSHQLRVHLAAVGHPILGDPLYAPPTAAALADRLQLHALELSLAHPATGEPMTWRAACPF
jgi:tRNA pseudouridine32 synthase/23S rRNA pseudouridine746 synthase